MSEIGFLNTGLPLLVLSIAGFLLPRLLLPKGSRSHRDAALAVGASALILWIVGAVGFAGLLVAQGFDLEGGFALSRMQMIQLLLARSALAALIWGPIMLLAWLSITIRINRDQGRALAARPDERG